MTTGPLVFAYNVYRVKAGVKIDWMGGTPNIANAAEIAIGVYVAWMALNPSKNNAVAVFDSTDKIVAYIGSHKDMV